MVRSKPRMYALMSGKNVYTIKHSTIGNTEKLRRK